jgi:Tol biopolymer transport system component
VWDRTDSLVAEGKVSRTFFWGPEPRDAVQEQYVDAPGGTNTRLVQYFDKSRMEINDPNADPNAPFFVTNGLLTIELISGQMQIGNNAFVERYSAHIPISGDIDDLAAPTYNSFLNVSNTRRRDFPAQNRGGQFATSTINKAGQVGNDPAKANDPLARVEYFEPATRHNIPAAFWQFLNATGPVSETGQIVPKRLIEPWFYASGVPISEPYWTRVKIAGVANVEVMIQAYERRVLTYVPTNPQGFRVEMGNIGIHYRDWRYRDAGRPTGTPATSTPGSPVATSTGVPGTPTATATLGTPQPTSTGTPPTSTPTVTATPNVVTQGYVIFTSNRTTKKQIWRVRGDGTGETNLTASSVASNNDQAQYSPDYTKIVFVSDRDGNPEIYVMNADGSGITRLTNDAQVDHMPSWSPDGSKIVFVSRRNGGQDDIYVMNSNGTNPQNITLLPGSDRDPSWGSNDRIIFTSGRSGTSQLYTMNPDGTALSAALTSAGENYLAQWNNRGNRIVFVSTRDGGQQEIYTMRQGGEEQTRITNNTFADWDPTYAPDDSKIAFSSERTADNLELYTMSIDGSNQEKITIELADDNKPDWGLQR